MSSESPGIGTLHRWLPPLVLLLLLAGPVVVSPDSVEMAMAGACMWKAPFVAGACQGLEPWFWPPAWPLALGLPVALGLDPAVVAALGSAVCFALLCLPLGALARRTCGVSAGLLVAPLLVALPAVRLHALMGDARGLFLLCLAGATALVAGHWSRPRALALGLCLGLAALARPEAMLFAGGLLALGTLRWGARIWPALVGFLALIGPYLGALSAMTGRLTPTSRGWQSAAWHWLQVLPEDAVKNELAAGAWGTPLRRVLSTSEVSASIPASVDPGLAAEWLGLVAQQTVPPWLALVALLGLGIALHSKAWRGLGALAALALPAGVVLLIPQAQDPVLPANNALPLLVGLLVLGAVGLGTLVDLAHGRGLPRDLGRLGAGGLALSLGFLVGPGLVPPPPLPPVADQASAWLMANTPGDAVVAASLVGAPVVLRARRERRRVPAPWSVGPWLEGPERPDLIVVASLDLPSLGPTLRGIEGAEALELVEVLGEGHEEWVRIYRLPRQAP